jgi:hypothetical protein
MAQITIPNAVRQGTVSTPSVVCPAGLSSAAIVVTMPNQSERDDVGNSMEVRLEFSTDGGTTFKSYFTVGWQGGSGYVDKQGVRNPPANMTLAGDSLGALSGSRLRCTFVIPNAVTAGCVITAL